MQMMNNGEQAIVLAKTLGAMAKEADMVRVVRCKDCIHNGSYDTDCPITWKVKKYCSFGERGEADDD